jgi:hypothetical protein
MCPSGTLRCVIGSGVWLLAAAVVAAGDGAGSAEQPAELRVSGAVDQPLRLRLDDLRRLPRYAVQLSEVHRDGSFHGTMRYRGASLRQVLELARLGKSAGAFRKPTDLAIAVRDRRGRSVLLSWGEVFYSDPGRFILATGWTPVRPHKACSRCHQPAEAQPRLEQLQRRVALPKLVPAGVIYGDRAMEPVAAIAVVEPRPAPPAADGVADGGGHGRRRLYAPEVRLDGVGVAARTFDALPADVPRRELTAVRTGEGTGFHGLRHYSGVRLRALLEAAGFAFEPQRAVVLSAPDGYQVLVSAGELFAPDGNRILLADRCGGRPLEAGGRFQLVAAGDLHADRWLKAVARIEVIDWPPK